MFVMEEIVLTYLQDGTLPTLDDQLTLAYNQYSNNACFIILM